MALNGPRGEMIQDFSIDKLQRYQYFFGVIYASPLLCVLGLSSSNYANYFA